MFLAPIKGKLRLRDHEAEELYKVSEYHAEVFWGKPYCYSAYRADYKCRDYDQAISKLILLAVERTAGYFIPGTDIPYSILAMRVWAKMNTLDAINEHQMAGLAWVLVYHKFASADEIREICGCYVADLVTAKRYKKDEENMEEFNAIDDAEDSEAFVVINEIQEGFVRAELSVLLNILRRIRMSHDCAFRDANPMPPRCFSEDVEESYLDERDDDYEESYNDKIYEEYLAREEYDYSNYRSPDYAYSGPSFVYYKKGFFNYEYDDYEYGHLPGDVVKYVYTPEYMAYCDKCRDLFWQRFGLAYEDVEKLLLRFFWQDEEYWNPINDILYEVCDRGNIDK